ncbi:MerR family transcriptional regulator [Actinocorallia sp. A-T 12471]|uniref:transcriptional regulator FtsR n=1 Tax=Actinocorallia sp. A-T 12471 TaxID=3089813 RepID=UPI0029D08681|nr:MerR family transcriptional regulator [Actinocorallia sp. A-T 12471]MDX6739975.1 MerR family transcriptional regulator [Actinocorallia sp. A-T 12471]
MSSSAARAYMTIGDVLARLQGEFPDITPSKIRFLESEGLIEPDRTPAGYRKFTHADVERLRFILAAQRDSYLPLRVIKEQLESRPPRTLVAADSQPSAEVALTRRQLLDAAGITEALLEELEAYGLIRRAGGHFGSEALLVARTAARLAPFGLEARHLRVIKAAAERELDLVEQMIAPLLKRRAPGAHEEAGRTADELSALVLELHTALVTAGLRDSLGR